MSVYNSVGAAWSNNDPLATEQQTSIGRLSGGRYVVAWVDGSGGANSIRAQIFNANGTAAGAQFVVNDPPNPAEQHAKSNPTVTTLDDGTFVIAWDEVGRGTNGNGIVAHVYDEDGASLGNPFLAGSYSNADISGAMNPRIIAAGGDQFYVVSQSSPPSGSPNVFAQLVDSAGTVLGGRTQINAALTGGEQIIAFDAAKLGSGSSVVAYVKGAGSAASIVATIVDAAMQPIGPEIVVDASAPSSIGRNADAVSVAALADGTFAVKWIENSTRSGFATDVWVQLYSGTGTAVGNAILVASTGGSYPTSDVTALDDGNFLVTWQNSASTNGAGLYGQVFDGAGIRVGLTFQMFAGTNGTVQITGVDGGGFAVTAINALSASGNTIARLFSTGSVQATTGDDIIVLRPDHIGAVSGLGGNDLIYGDDNDNILRGGAGNDTLVGGQGNDTLDGGANDDTAVFGGAASNYQIVQTGVGQFEISLRNGGFTGVRTLINVEYLRFADKTIDLISAGAGTGTAGNDVLTGGTGDDVLRGLGGNDQLSGLGGNDTLDGGTGNDTMSGGSGDDTYLVDSTTDRVTELVGEGADTVQTALAVYRLGNNVENLTFTYSDTGAHSGTGNALDNAITGGGGADTLGGLDGNDVLQGLGGADTLNGGAGNDTLDGGTGIDTMIGGGGNDRYIVDSSGDIIREFAAGGTDTVEASASYTLSLNVENLTLTGSAAINGTGNAGANGLTGNAGNNVLSGLGGADTIDGGEGNDTLNGGSGLDRLTGGLGADTFVFSTLATTTLGSTVDTVTDFAAGEGDKLAFSKTVFTALGVIGALGVDAFFAGTAAQDATDRIIYNQATGNLFYDPDGTGSKAAVLVATLGEVVHPALSFADILIVA
jgi:Ca2+-binding RTX toxin-like protein